MNRTKIRRDSYLNFKVVVSKPFGEWNDEDLIVFKHGLMNRAIFLLAAEQRALVKGLLERCPMTTK